MQLASAAAAPTTVSEVTISFLDEGDALASSANAVMASRADGFVVFNLYLPRWALDCHNGGSLSVTPTLRERY